jgi:hypothetical protein
MVVLSLLLAGPAWALQTTRSGPLLELAAGGGVAGARATGTGQLTMGWWRGRYDDEYALGRFSALLLTTRADLGRDALRVAPMLEARRSVDLFVVAPWIGLSAGPLVVQDEVGVSMRAAGGLKFRRSRTLGFTGRLSAGADVLAGRVTPAVHLTIGVGWSTPARRAQP